MNCKILMAWLGIIGLSGCSTVHLSGKFYPGPELPLSEVGAVFIGGGNASYPTGNMTITKVNGQERVDPKLLVTAWRIYSPTYITLKPGSNTLTVQVIADHSLVAYGKAIGDVSVDVIPGHAYYVNYQIDMATKEIRFFIVDKGKGYDVACFARTNPQIGYPGLSPECL